MAFWWKDFTENNPPCVFRQLRDITLMLGIPSPGEYFAFREN
jgi:hypothetical protein